MGEMIRNAEEHLLQLINDVLDMSRIESDKVEIEEAPHDLHDCADRLNAMVTQRAEEQQLDYDMRFVDVKNWNIYVDVLRMNQVLLNILSNSVKYTKPGGKIDFTVRELPSDKPGFANFDFTVADTGIGMSRSFMTHLFEAFAREKPPLSAAFRAPASVCPSRRGWSI